LCATRWLPLTGEGTDDRCRVHPSGQVNTERNITAHVYANGLFKQLRVTLSWAIWRIRIPLDVPIAPRPYLSAGINF
jgi:hypothetical protein